MAVYVLFPYSNTTYIGSYLGPIFIWALTQIYPRGTNTRGLSRYTLVSSPRDSMWIADPGQISNLQIFELYIIFEFSFITYQLFMLSIFHRDFGKWAWCFWRIRNQLIAWTNTHYLHQNLVLGLKFGTWRNLACAIFRSYQRMKSSIS
jgi:hypothetical protein